MICLGNQPTQIHVDFERYEMLPPEGRRLISDWFARSWEMREYQGNACCEAFFFAWIAVNGWAECVTECDRDTGPRGYVDALECDSTLCQDFAKFVADRESPFACAVKQFAEFWPIFKDQSLRRSGVSRLPGKSREEMVSRYLEQGNVLFAPQCAKRHREAGEKIPIDWPHTLAALYQVRCNFFLGEKALSSEMDQQIVSCAYKTLLYFFQQGKYISSS